MKLAPDAKRIGIFAFFDKDGIVDEYIPVLIGAVRRHCTYLLCVVNGTVNDAGRSRLEAVCDEVLLRPNEGLDITGYKEGLFHLRSQVDAADEVLFFNQTIFGPVCSPAPMFAEMADRDLDFWGLTMHKGLKADLTGTIWSKVEYGYLPPHIQSYFFAVRGRLLHAPDFWDYWQQLPVIHSYIEAVSFHEVKFTKYFTDLGYHGEPYIDCSGWNEYIDYGLMGMPATLVTEMGCPFVKRKSFFEPRMSVLGIPQGGTFWELYRLLASRSDYPVRYILENLTRTVPCFDYTISLAPTFCPRAGQQADGRMGLVLWISDKRLLPHAAAAAATLPADGVLICLVTAAVPADAAQAALPGALLLREDENGFARLFEDLWPRLAGLDTLCYLPLCPPAMSDDLSRLSPVNAAAAALGDLGADLAMLRQTDGIGILVPIPDTVENVLTSCRICDAAELQDLLGSTPLGDLPLGKRLLLLPTQAFFAECSALAPLAALPQQALRELPPHCQSALLPLSAQAGAQLLGFAAPWEDAVRELWNAREQLARLGSIFETPGRKSTDGLAFRMKGIADFYDERRYDMTLEQAFTAKLSGRQKLWIILQLLFSPAAFARIRRAVHGGKQPPAPQHPHDPLDD